MSIKETFSAGQTREFFADGDFFRLLETTAEVTIEYYFQGREMAEAVGVQAGYAESFVRNGERFDRVRIYSATAQDVKWVVRLGSDVRYDRGAASITGTVALDLATLAEMEGVGIEQVEATGAYKTSASLAAVTADVVFTPGANTNGAVILTADFLAVNGGSVNSGAAFVAKASTPAGPTDGEVICSASGLFVSGTSYYEAGSLKQAQLLPAGLGLYFIGSNSCASGYMRHARYRLL